MSGQMRRKLLTMTADPTCVMVVVSIMYVLKAMLKIWVGSRIHSPMISGDGYHNLADLLEAGAVIAVIFVSRRPSTEKYPFGRKNIEFFTSLAIGLGLLVMAVQFALKSAVGILHFFPNCDGMLRAVLPLPAHEQLLLDAASFPWALAITAGSVVASFAIGRYQIAIGKKSGHASLVADGEETVSDGTIESVTVAGVLGEHLLHLTWLEYPLGLLVAVLIARTGWQLLVGACRVLLQHSIGVDHDARIKTLAKQVPGVVAVTDLKTFQVGHIAVCMITLTSRAGALSLPYVRYGVEDAVERYLLGQSFKECEIHIRLERPDPQYRRIAYAVTRRGDCTIIAHSLQTTTHFRFCDEEEGELVRIKEEPVPADPLALLREKRVAELFFFADCQSNDIAALGQALPGITVSPAVSFLPEVMGLAS